MHNQNIIEEIPFFISYQGKDKAVVDLKAFYRWLENVEPEVMTEELKAEKARALEDLQKGEVVDWDDLKKELEL